MMLQRISRMVLPFSCDVSLMRFIWRRECTNDNPALVHMNAGLPSTFPFHHSDEIPIWKPDTVGVLGIPSTRNNAQIGNSIVMSNAVDMVDFALRKRAIRIEPRQPMSRVFLPVHSDNKITIDVWRSCNVAFGDTVRSPELADESTVLLVVIQKSAQSFSRQCFVLCRALYKIIKSGIMAVTVKRDNAASRECSVTVEPCKLQNRIGASIDHNGSHWISSRAGGNFSECHSIASCDPSKNASSRLIVEQLFHLISGDKVAHNNSIASTKYLYFNGMAI